MKTSSHFSSKHSALVLGTILTASTVFAGVTLAQGLNIPTNLSNAVITIQRIVLSDNGTNPSISNPGSTIEFDGSNGNITTKVSTSGIGGNLTIGGGMQFTRSDYQCPFGATDCYLKVDETGNVVLTDTLSGSSNSGNNDGVFRRTAGNDNNIFLARTDGTEADVGNNTTTQQYLRVGANSDNGAPVKPDTAMVVAGKTESRGGLLIRKDNTDTIPSNAGVNKQVQITEDFTELDLNTTAGKINFKSLHNIAGDINNSTSFMFSAGGTATTKVGVNFDGSANPVSGTPKAELHVRKGGKFVVGSFPGEPSTCGFSGGFWMCTSDQAPSAFIVDSATNSVGIGVNELSDLEKTLNVEGEAGISNTLHVGSSVSVGHIPTYDPGTDKLAINGNARANAYYYNSDRRYKSDIEVLKSPLENLLKISGYSYFNKLSEKKDLGVIAQEVEAVYPELVQTDAEGYKSVQYGNLVAPIIEAIKELATKIDNLFNLYVSQQAKIDTLEARLLKLEAQLK